jgi:hypothetical protein
MLRKLRTAALAATLVAAAVPVLPTSAEAAWWGWRGGWGGWRGGWGGAVWASVSPPARSSEQHWLVRITAMAILTMAVTAGMATATGIHPTHTAAIPTLMALPTLMDTHPAIMPMPVRIGRIDTGWGGPTIVTSLIDAGTEM